MADAKRPGHPPGRDAGAAHDAILADGSDRCARAGELRLARYIVVLGSAWLHRAAQSLGILVDPSSSAFPGIARVTIASRNDGLRIGGLFDAPCAARRRGADDRQRRR